MAVPHYTYMVLKMLGPREIITIKGSFELSDLCDKEFHKIAQAFGMIAKYWQLKGKTHKEIATTT
jgi:predicted DNA-binding protein (MmcQ/YjbR family)